MNPAILNPDVQEFINAHLNTDVTKLLLKGTPFNTISIKDIVEQIEAKKKCKSKLPTWFASKNIYFPNKLNIEQTSSEATADYKSQLVNGESIIDITGGFGVDAYYFSKQFKKVVHCDINDSLSDIVAHNYKQFGVENIVTVSNDGVEFLKNSKIKYDWIYIDPSRRHDSKGKVFFLKDCLPNVPEHLEVLFEYSSKIMIKTAPLLDISVGISELQYVKTIHVVALDNDVKELLWVLEKGYSGKIVINTVNIKKTRNDLFSFNMKDEVESPVKYNLPLTYLYEPNSAILKAGGFNSIASYYNLSKLHKHTHLYTSDKEISNVPGRQFIIEKVIDYSKGSLKKLNVKKANITIRNFPETVSQIRKKFKISEGGNIYLFFTTNSINNKVILYCKKLN